MDGQQRAQTSAGHKHPPGDAPSLRPRQAKAENDQWRGFNHGFFPAAWLGIWVAQIIGLSLNMDLLTTPGEDVLPKPAQVLFPSYPLLLLLPLAYLSHFSKWLMEKLSLSEGLLQLDGKQRLQAGVKAGLLLAVAAGLPPCFLPSFLAELAALVKPGFILAALCFLVPMAGTTIILQKRGWPPQSPWQPLPPIDPGAALKPLYSKSALYCSDEKSESMAARQAARPDSWREAWPDDPELIEARDRLSRLIRFYCGFLSEAFLPDDRIYAFCAVGEEYGQSGDLIDFMADLQLLFDVNITAEEAHCGLDITYLELLRRLMGQAPPNYAAPVDEKHMRALSLPDNYDPYSPKDARHHHDRLRRQQAWRSPYWRRLWPDDPAFSELRAQVGRILAQEIYWFDQAFLPHDRLNALFHSYGQIPAAAKALEHLNLTRGVEMDLEDVLSGQFSFHEFLEHISRRQAKFPVK